MAIIFAIKTIMPFSFSRDPFSGSYGSASFPTPRSGPVTQHMPLSQLHILLYVVSLPCPVTARSAPEKGGVVIPSPCYTSGNGLITQNPDHTGTAKR